MKTKHTLIILLIGFSISIVGVLLKVNHSSIGVISGNLLITIGIVSETVGIIPFLYKVFTNPTFKKLLDS